MPCPNHPDVLPGLESCARCSGSFCADCLVWLRGRTYCAACKFEQVRDLLSGIVPGALDLAPTGRRFAGLFIDNMLSTIAAYAVMIPVMMIGMAATTGMGRQGGPAVWLVLLTYPILFGIPLLYEALMLRRGGQSLGKMALGVKVVTPEGGDISTGQAWARAALKLVLGSCMGIDYLPAFFTRERTCLHDLIAKTRVVRVR